MSKSTDQAIFDEVSKRSQFLGYKTYDYKPLDGVPYPFVELEGTQFVPNATKTSVKGSIIVDLSVWVKYNQRSTGSEMAQRLYNECLSISKANGYQFSLNASNSDIRTLDDTSTNTPLKRFMLSLEFRIL
ncbi:phage capsid protein [Enterococcus sp. AZ102]|uniref:phage capsid protein n=1 Tax=Enterococcus sp. AZ102 TaxID=2774865 RepID=UPI003F687835